ncbi:MAG: glutamyl-tRNA reductase [Planctomycetota bacterium]|jgi:glutamyl-tRNA reductase|nr:glutamyl-tRNA reductase [Planctomycetota bacterium]
MSDIPVRLFCLSINFRNVPLGRREEFACGRDSMLSLLQKLGADRTALEAAVLSTCHRFEVYGVLGPSASPDAVAAKLAGHVGLAPAGMPAFDCFRDFDAVGHLFRVAAGLDSLVLGENQILFQVKDAYRLACEAETSGFYLNACFHRAFRVGKAVRGHTSLSAGGSSVGTVAVDMAARENGGLAGKRVLVVGAGEIGALCLRAARLRNPRSLTLANRVSRRGPAAELAAKYGARFAPLESLAEEIRSHDLVFSATASTDAVISLEMLKNVEKVSIYDLALPRDVEPGAERLAGVTYRTVDDVRPHADYLASERAEAVPAAERIVGEALADFESWSMELAVVPSIRRILELGAALQAGEDAFLQERLSGECLETARRSVRRLSQNLMRNIIGELKRTARNTSRRSAPGGD